MARTPTELTTTQRTKVTRILAAMEDERLARVRRDTLIVEAVRGGVPVAHIAAETGMSRATIHRLISVSS